MRHAIVACTAIALVATAGCARQGASPKVHSPPRYAEILSREPPRATPRDSVRRPRGDCLARALAYVPREADLLAEPLPDALRSRLEPILDGLHPAAQRVLARTRGVWFAQNMVGAAAAFLPCEIDADEARGGFVLVDVGQFPLDGTALRDRDVPGAYWRALGAPPERRPVYDARRLSPGETPADHAVRYLLLHEIGHALSVLAGEFDVAPDGTTRIASESGFVGLSWRLFLADRRAFEARAPGGFTAPRLVTAVEPRGPITSIEWGMLLLAQLGEPTEETPAYALAARRALERPGDLCAAVRELPAAGFVTPVAARYPTEDFAEMFAHAILADEGKLTPDTPVSIDLAACEVRSIPSPYHADGVALKRAYLERALAPLLGR